MYHLFVYSQNELFTSFIIFTKKILCICFSPSWTLCRRKQSRLFLKGTLIAVLSSNLTQDWILTDQEISEIEINRTQRLDYAQNIQNIQTQVFWKQDVLLTPTL
jgi:hypothetical protein